MDIRPIRTEEDYQTALREVEALFDAQTGSPEADRLEVLIYSGLGIPVEALVQPYAIRESKVEYKVDSDS